MPNPTPADLLARLAHQLELATEMAEMCHGAQPEAEGDWLALADDLRAAADTIAALQAEQERLKAGLGAIADALRWATLVEDDSPWDGHLMAGAVKAMSDQLRSAESALADALRERDEARDKLKTAEAERDRLREALHNVRLSAAMQVAYKSRKTQEQHEKSWRDVLRFCESAGVVGSVTRAALAEGGRDDAGAG